MIYFILSSKNMINISKRDRPEKALWELRKHSSDPDEKFDLVGKIEGSTAELAEIREIFSDLHSHNDWYRSNENLTCFIKRICSKK